MTRWFATSLVLLSLVACADKSSGDTGSGGGGDGDDTDTPPCDLAADPDCDGYTADEGDCEPNNATAYPGARELPYDGLDNDCAGDGDLVDVDGDGFVADIVGGDDCNDSNPEINPAAQETCYDNIDYDCDGFPADGEVESDDCDGDGSPRGADCNDEDPEVYPGADEVWYDGLDQNCSGTIEDDYDQDGDGERWSGSSVGGTDCDDEDPLTGTNQPEQLDGKDNDCDSVVDTIGVLDASFAFYGSIGSGEGWFGASVVPLDDYDGDGRRDFGVGAPFSDEDTSLCDKVQTGGTYNILPCGGWFMVMPTDGTEGLPSDNYLARMVGSPGSSAEAPGNWLGMGATSMGDMDGDGWVEVAVGAPARASSGAILLYDGADIAAGGDINAGFTRATLRGPTYVGGMVESLADVDGDGINEIVGAPFAGVVGFYTGIGQLLNLTVWAGGDASPGASLLASDALAEMDGAGNGGELVGATDFDGDGLPDLIVGTDIEAEGKVLLWPGADIALGGSFTATDYAAVRGATTSLVTAGLGMTLGWLDDIDGDGYPEIAASAPLAEGAAEASGVVYVLNGASFIAGGVAGDLALASIEGSEYYGLMAVTSETEGDIDADGVSDLVVANLGGTAFAAMQGEALIFSGVDLAAGGSLALGNAIAVLPTRSYDDIYGATGIMWDIEGDGDSDLALTAPFNNDVGMAGVFISGFAD